VLPVAPRQHTDITIIMLKAGAVYLCDVSNVLTWTELLLTHYYVQQCSISWLMCVNILFDQLSKVLKVQFRAVHVIWFSFVLLSKLSYLYAFGLRFTLGFCLFDNGLLVFFNKFQIQSLNIEMMQWFSLCLKQTSHTHTLSALLYFMSFWFSVCFHSSSSLVPLMSWMDQVTVV